MRPIYAARTVNAPRLKTDRFFADYENRFQWEGPLDQAIRTVEEMQLLDPALWARFVDQFRQTDADADGGWRGEYWGKMMRGACFTYAYTKNPALYRILRDTAEDMLTTQEPGGRISSYAPRHEMDAWDLWSRKYVLLGLQYFLEISREEDLNRRILASLCGQVDAIMKKIGPAAEGKKPITAATRNWRGLNSCSLLEPIVRLYTLTGAEKYLDFSAYIVDCGGTDCQNLFDLAYENKLYPYQYPITKAYEMISCFEGLLEYYRITGVERYKTAILNFSHRILESDFTIIGSCGCTHELFDHSTVRQANTTNGPTAQETCVTVTLMKFFYQLLLLTGDARYADAFELSLYNAYLGAINTEGALGKRIPPDCVPTSLPFDSYSPLTAGMRGISVGGLCVMADHTYYGCCACIGSAGGGLAAKVALLSTKAGFCLNLYSAGTVETATPTGQKARFVTRTDYPVSGRIVISLELPQPECFEVLVRVPAWSENTALTVCGKAVPARPGYVSLGREWKTGDFIELSLDMRTRALRPIAYGHDILMNHVVWEINYMVSAYDEEDPLAKRHIALQRGPLILAQENRLGYSVDDPIAVAVSAGGEVAVRFPEHPIAPYPCMVEVCVPLQNGGEMRVTDYASAGKLWNEESKMAAWMLTQEA